MLPVQLVDYALGGPPPAMFQMLDALGDRFSQFYDAQLNAGMGPASAFFAALNVVGDMVGVNGIIGGIARQDLATGAPLSSAEGNAQIIVGSFSLATTFVGAGAAGAAGKAGSVSKGGSLASQGAKASRVSGATLNAKQVRILADLRHTGNRVIVPKRMVRMGDLVALSRFEGVEFALLTRRGERMIIRGGGEFVSANFRKLAADQWRLSAHTHPGAGLRALGSSNEDIWTLGIFTRLRGQQKSMILDQAGNRGVFDGGPDRFHISKCPKPLR